MLSRVKFSKDLNCKMFYLKTYPGRFFGYEKRGSFAAIVNFVLPVLTLVLPIVNVVFLSDRIIEQGP